VTIPEYLGLSGAGVQIGIMDSPLDHTHKDFAGRVIRRWTPESGCGGSRCSVTPDFHGTFVGSIAAGSGYQSDKLNDGGTNNGGSPFEWRGVAPRAEIAAYAQAGWSPTLMHDAIVGHGVDVTNHSYIGDLYGRYTQATRSFDGIVAGESVDPHVPARPAVIGVANNADVRPRDCNGVDGNWGTGPTDGEFPDYPGPAGGTCPTAYHAGYFSVLNACKNCVGVTALAKEHGEPRAPAEVQPRPEHLVHLPSSSLGPTLDGRLKPELAVPADFVFSGYPGNQYWWGGATSGAAPVVSGVIALMMEQHRKTSEERGDHVPVQPSTWKAILVQSAIDLSGEDPTPNFDTGQPVRYGPGPDFATGFGLVDAPSAVRMVADREFRVDSLTHDAPRDEFHFEIPPGEPELRMTLAWDDPAASVSQSVTSRTLVNDLDLMLIDPSGNVRRPLVLPTLKPRDCDAGTPGAQVGTCPGKDDPNQSYEQPAEPGIDRRNNVEQVVIKDPAAGAWKAVVTVRNDDRPGRLLLGRSDVRLASGDAQIYSLATGDTSSADLRIDVSDTPDPVDSGAGITYGITVTNDGPDRAPNTTVANSLPEGTVFLGDKDGACELEEDEVGIVRCTLGTLEAGAVRNLEIWAGTNSALIYDSGSDRTVTNTAEATSVMPDPDASDNVASEGTLVVGRASLEVITTFAAGTNAELTVGKPETVAVEMHVTNGGLSPADVTVESAATATDGTVAPTNAGQALHNVSPGETRVVVQQFEVKCAKAGTAMVMTATGSAMPAAPVSDPSLADNESSVSMTFDCTKKPKA
jgi:uncharacterized repeat protein (TIGR01451 family)